MKNDKGFTLIEVIVVALIASFIGYGVISAMANSIKIVNNSIKQAFIVGNVDLFMQDIGKDIKAGQKLESSDQITITGNIYNRKLVITGIDGKTVEWYSASGNLYRKNEDGNIRHYSLIGTPNDESFIEPHFTETEIVGVYYGVGIELFISAKSSNVYYTSNSAANRYYCRVPWK